MHVRHKQIQFLTVLEGKGENTPSSQLGKLRNNWVKNVDFYCIFLGQTNFFGVTLAHYFLKSPKEL